MQIKGINLTKSDQIYVLAAYVHRFTGEHRPKWANGLRPDGTPYRVQFKSDIDWLENTIFFVKNDGTLDGRFKRCESTPTWPE